MNKKILTLASYFKNPILFLFLKMQDYKNDITIYVVEDGPYENGHNKGKTFYLGKTSKKTFPISTPKTEKNILVRIRGKGITQFQSVLPTNGSGNMSCNPILYKDLWYEE